MKGTFNKALLLSLVAGATLSFAQEPTQLSAVARAKAGRPFLAALVDTVNGAGSLIVETGSLLKNYSFALGKSGLETLKAVKHYSISNPAKTALYAGLGVVITAASVFGIKKAVEAYKNRNK